MFNVSAILCLLVSVWFSWFLTVFLWDTLLLADFPLLHFAYYWFSSLAFCYFRFSFLFFFFCFSRHFPTFFPSACLQLCLQPVVATTFFLWYVWASCIPLTDWSFGVRWVVQVDYRTAGTGCGRHRTVHGSSHASHICSPLLPRSCNLCPKYMAEVKHHTYIRLLDYF